jgi:hypothetical protein
MLEYLFAAPELLVTCIEVRKPAQWEALTNTGYSQARDGKVFGADQSGCIAGFDSLFDARDVKQLTAYVEINVEPG